MALEDLQEELIDIGGMLMYMYVNQGAMPTGDKNHQKQELISGFRALGEGLLTLLQTTQTSRTLTLEELEAIRSYSEVGKLLSEGALRIENVARLQEITEIRDDTLSSVIKKIDEVCEPYYRKGNKRSLRSLFRGYEILKADRERIAGKYEF